MLKKVLNQPNVIGRLMIVLLFAGGVVFAGAFDGFVVETEASNCCGGGTDGFIFSSSECCDEDPCGECGCEIAGCSSCSDSMIGCGGKCDCQDPLGPEGSCNAECPSSTDKKNVCENDCGL